MKYAFAITLMSLPLWAFISLWISVRHENKLAKAGKPKMEPLTEAMAVTIMFIGFSVMTLSFSLGIALLF